MTEEIKYDRDGIRALIRELRDAVDETSVNVVRDDVLVHFEGDAAEIERVAGELVSKLRLAVRLVEGVR